MKSAIPILICLSYLGVAGAEVQEKSAAAATAKAALLEKARDRIFWYDDEKESPILIPEEVFGLAPLQELPIPIWIRESIRLWMARQKKEPSSGATSERDCFYPGTTLRRLIPGPRQLTLEEAMAGPLAVLLVSVDRATVGLRPDLGIFQYNAVKIIDILPGAGGQDQNPLSTRAFLSEGGQIEVEGTHLCSKSPWHRQAPRSGDTYLLIGAPDIYGIFNAVHYFRIDGGNVVPASYSELAFPKDPLPLAEVWAAAGRLRNAVPPFPPFQPLPNGERPHDPADDELPEPAKRPGGPRGLTQTEGDVFCEEFQGLCDSSVDLAWRRQEACIAECRTWSHYGDKVGTCHWDCGPEPTPPAWRREQGAYGNGPRLAFLNLRDGDSLAGRPVLRGFALAFADVASLDLFWNGRRLNLRSLKMRLPCPEACVSPLGVNRIPCGPDSGFEAEIDSTVLPDGPGRLALVATSRGGWTTSLELELVVTNKK